VETTVTAIIDDCGNQIHFSARFLENHLSRLDNGTDHAINELNGKIFKNFNTSIDNINITSDLDRLTELSDMVNSTELFDVVNSTAIQEKVQQIQDDLTTIETRFQNITDSIPTLPTNLVNQTISDVSIKKNNER